MIIPPLPPQNSQGNVVLLTVFEVLTCGANTPHRDLLLLHPTAFRFATGDEGGVFVPQAVWAAVDNLQLQLVSTLQFKTILCV